MPLRTQMIHTTSTFWANLAANGSNVNSHIQDPQLASNNIPSSPLAGVSHECHEEA